MLHVSITLTFTNQGQAVYLITVFPQKNAVAFIKFRRFQVRRLLEGGIY